jgi:hypothetical protein
VEEESGGNGPLILWHPKAANSLDPETGEVYWSVPFKSRAGMTIATPRKLRGSLGGHFACPPDFHGIRTQR